MPSDLLKMSGRELLSAIRMSEGRTLRVAARIRCSNLIDGVSNAEVAAAFGADIINLDTYDLFNSYIPGWTSKNPQDDASCSLMQTPLGIGYSFKEIEEIVSRPLSVLMLISNDLDGAERTRKAYGNIVATKETFLKAKEEHVRCIQVDTISDTLGSSFVEQIKEIRQLIGDDMILHVARSHGSGILNKENSGDLIDRKQVVDLIKAGVDIIGFPAPGTYPGWDIKNCKDYVDLAHSYGAVVVLGVHTSQEGANPNTLEHIALCSKMCGADMHDLGDCGFNENMIDPINIMRYGIAIRGKRHHYRRMAVSNKR